MRPARFERADSACGLAVRTRIFGPDVTGGASAQVAPSCLTRGSTFADDDFGPPPSPRFDRGRSAVVSHHAIGVPGTSQGRRSATSVVSKRRRRRSSANLKCAAARFSLATAIRRRDGLAEPRSVVVVECLRVVPMSLWPSRRLTQYGHGTPARAMFGHRIRSRRRRDKT